MPQPPAKIRVAHIITRMILGGAQENTLFTVEGLQAIPLYDVRLLTGPALGPEGELIRRATDRGVQVDLAHEMRRELNPVLDCLALGRLLALLRRFRPHIVHTHSSKAGILGRAAARILHTPVVVHTIHGLPFRAYAAPMLRHMLIQAERLAAGWTDRIISVADAMTEQALAAGVGRPELYATIYSGMEVDTFGPREGVAARVRAELGIPQDALVVGKVSRIFAMKGHQYLVSAAPQVVERFPNAKFLFVGDGSWRGKIEAQIRALGLTDRFVFAGLVDPARIPDMILAMDVLVHASLREGLARVLPQALLSECPVVSYDVDGAPEVIIDRETGRLVPAKAVDALAAAIVDMLADPALAKRMAQKGRKLCLDLFPVERMVRDIDRLYRQLLAAKGVSTSPRSTARSGRSRA